jgi:hypothetical protein
MNRRAFFGAVAAIVGAPLMSAEADTKKVPVVSKFMDDDGHCLLTLRAKCDVRAGEGGFFDAGTSRIYGVSKFDMREGEWSWVRVSFDR